jgi:hypothetical protein
MVGVFVDHDLIANPVPISDDVVIVRGDVPVEIVKPKAFPVSAREPEYMLRSKAAGEAPMRPWLGDLVMRVAGSTVMSNPPVVPGVDVRNVRMTGPVHGNVVLGRGGGLVTAFGGGSPRRLGSRRWSGTASRYVSSADRGVTAAARSFATTSVLRDCSGTNQNGQRYSFLQRLTPGEVSPASSHARALPPGL